MKICAISDLHGILPSVPECDVLCIAGDVVDLIVQRSSDESDAWWSTAFITWVDKLSCEKIFVVPGNHDIYIEQLYDGLIKDTTLQEFKDKISLLTNDKVVFLIDELYEYEGVKFYGTPWIAPIHWQKWAFEDTQHEYDEYVCPMKIYLIVIYLLLMKIQTIMKSLNITVLVSISIISLGIGITVYHTVILINITVVF
jgi:Icc-related predicted phosphoesterase